MKLFISLLLIIFYSSNLFSLSKRDFDIEGIVQTSAYPSLSVLKKDGVIFLASHKGKIIFYSYDWSLNILESKELEFKNEPLFIDVIDNKIYLFSSFKNKGNKTHYLYKSIIDLSSFEIIETKAVLAHKVENKYYMLGEYKVLCSPDGQRKTLLYKSPSYKHKKQFITIGEMDTNYFLMNKFSYPLEKGKGNFNIMKECALANNGNIFLSFHESIEIRVNGFKSRQKKRVSYMYSDSKKGLTKIGMFNRTNEMFDYKFHFSNTNELCSVLAHNNSTILLTYRSDSLSIFSDTHRNVRRESEKRIRHIENLTDGYIVVSDLIEISNTTNPHTGSPAAIQYYSDIVIEKIDLEGNVMWKEIIPRNKITINGSSSRSSFAVKFYSGIVYVIYNSGGKKNEVLCAKIHEDIEGRYTEVISDGEQNSKYKEGGISFLNEESSELFFVLKENKGWRVAKLNLNK